MNLFKFKQYIDENKAFADSLPMFRNWLTEQYYALKIAFKNNKPHTSTSKSKTEFIMLQRYLCE